MTNRNPEDMTIVLLFQGKQDKNNIFRRKTDLDINSKSHTSSDQNCLHKTDEMTLNTRAAA
jgi:hypothetical protein